MRKNLPGKNELLVLFGMAAACTIVLGLMPARDSGLFYLTFPLFVTSAILGLKKNGRLRSDSDE